MKRNDELNGWHWPYLRYSDGPEYECPHGVGHGNGIHGCDGCCGHKSYVEASQRRKQNEAQ